MRKLVFALILFTVVLNTGCSKDKSNKYANPENLSGTTWKCTSGTDWNVNIEYALFIFPSATSIEGWTKYVSESLKKDWIGAFSISNNEISISTENESFTGIIDGETMNMTMDGESYVFRRQ